MDSPLEEMWTKSVIATDLFRLFWGLGFRLRDPPQPVLGFRVQAEGMLTCADGLPSRGNLDEERHLGHLVTDVVW